MNEILYDTYRLTVRFTDIDSYGIAHHSKYLVWFEECRIHFINRIDSQDIWRKYRFMLTRAEVEYKQAVVHGGSYVVEMEAAASEDIAKLDFTYKIRECKTGRICAKGATSHVITDCRNKLLIEMPKELGQMWKLAGDSREE